MGKKVTTRSVLLDGVRVHLERQGSQVDETVLKKAADKGCRWMRAAYGEVDWNSWSKESGFVGVVLALCSYYSETIQDPSGKKTFNHQTRGR